MVRDLSHSRYFWASSLYCSHFSSSHISTLSSGVLGSAGSRCEPRRPPRGCRSPATGRRRAALGPPPAAAAVGRSGRARACQHLERARRDRGHGGCGAIDSSQALVEPVGARCHGEPLVLNDSAMKELRFNEKGYHYYHGLKLHEDEGYFQFQDFR